MGSGALKDWGLEKAQSGHYFRRTWITSDSYHPAEVTIPMMRHATLRCEAGATAVELTFSLMAFLLFMIVTIEAGIIGFRTLTAQYIASQTAREAAIFAGNTASGTNIARVQVYSFNLANRMGMNFPSQATWNANHMQVCRLEDITSFSDNRCTNGNNFGAPDDFISVRIAIPSRFLLQTIQVTVVGWGVSRNEPF